MTPLGIFAHSLELRTTTSPLFTLKPTGRLRLRIDLYLKSSKLGSRGQRMYGQKSYQAYYGRIEQRPEHLQERHRFD